MTLDALIKALLKMQAKGYGHAKVTCDKSTLFDGNGCWEVCDIRSVKPERVVQSDGDGSTKLNRNGTEHTRLCVVFSGEAK
jgi:hypothetical protein